MAGRSRYLLGLFPSQVLGPAVENMGNMIRIAGILAEIGTENHPHTMKGVTARPDYLV
jgi:hypothetical protein